MKNLFTVLSGLTIAVAYVPYIIGTVRGSVVPSRASWIVWFVQDVLMASSAIMAGIGPAAVMPVVWGLGATIMVVLSLKKGAHQPFSLLEKSCLALSGLGILLWVATGSPRLALMASVSAACIGGIPTVVKSWAQPQTESLSAWLLNLLAIAFSCLAIQKWTFDSGFLPIAVGTLQLAIILPLILYAINGRAESRA